MPSEDRSLGDNEVNEPPPHKECSQSVADLYTANGFGESEPLPIVLYYDESNDEIDFSRAWGWYYYDFYWSTYTVKEDVYSCKSTDICFKRDYLQDSYIAAFEADGSYYIVRNENIGDGPWVDDLLEISDNAAGCIRIDTYDHQHYGVVYLEEESGGDTFRLYHIESSDGGLRWSNPQSIRSGIEYLFNDGDNEAIDLHYGSLEGGPINKPYIVFTDVDDATNEKRLYVATWRMEPCQPIGWYADAYDPPMAPNPYIRASEGADPFCVVGCGFYFYDNPSLTLDEDNEVAEAPDNAVEPVSLVYPNPATDRVKLELKLENAAFCSYRIYDLADRCVGEEHLGLLAAGRHIIEIPLDEGGRTLPNGVYSVSIATDGRTTNRRIVVR